MGFFMTMEKAFAGTAFYQTYLSKWPPPFNIASFDVCLILFFVFAFIGPIIRDAVMERIREKRERRWLEEFQRKQAEGFTFEDLESDDGKQERRWIWSRNKDRQIRKKKVRRRRKPGDYRHRRSREQRKREKSRELEILDEDYFFDEEDDHGELEAAMQPTDKKRGIGNASSKIDAAKVYEQEESSHQRYTGDREPLCRETLYEEPLYEQQQSYGRLYASVYGEETAMPETIDEFPFRGSMSVEDEQYDPLTDYTRWEEEALTEMDFMDGGKEYTAPMLEEGIQPPEYSADYPEQYPEPEEADFLRNMEVEGASEAPQAESEDEFTRLMNKIRRTQEEKAEAKQLANEQEENRQRKLDAIDRKLTEKIRSREQVPDQTAATQDIALEQAKRAAMSEKQAEAELRRKRERKYQNRQGGRRHG